METNVAGPLAGIAVTNGFDTLLRRNLLVTRKTSVLTSTEYDYDNASRLQTVTDGTNSGNYGYPDNSSLVSQIVFKQNTDVRMTTGKSYDHQNRLTEIDSLDGAGHTFDLHAYGYNDLDQRTVETNMDGAYWSNGYDFLGQVTSRVKHWSGGGSVPGEQFGYGFDDIGNRTNALMGGDQWGNRLRLATYTANTLNQYTSRTVPGAVDILGSATNVATVTVNGQATYRRSNFYEATLTLTNTNAPVWLTVSNVALLNEGTNDVLKANVTGNMYAPKTPESFSYDADGNLTNDGRWSYVWDGENRLINMTSHVGDPAGSLLKLDFVYDWMGRRIQKLVSTNNAGTYVPEYTNRFVYDRWNLLAIFNPSSMIESFMWGLDLSGTLQGAGGVGGLLKMAYHGSSTTNCFPAFDGNGNLMSLASSIDGTIVAQYEYGPFGEFVRATGPMAKLNPIRFSTKYQDDEVDLIYYGRRFLNSSAGRWLSRDPIVEKGGLNLYAFVKNAPCSFYDKIGLCTRGVVCCPQCEIHISNGDSSPSKDEANDELLAAIGDLEKLDGLLDGLEFAGTDAVAEALGNMAGDVADKTKSSMAEKALEHIQDLANNAVGEMVGWNVYTRIVYKRCVPGCLLTLGFNHMVDKRTDWSLYTDKGGGGRGFGTKIQAYLGAQKACDAAKKKWSFDNEGYNHDVAEGIY